MSHKASTKVEFNNPDAFRAAVEALGWTWIGEGSHRQYNGSHAGLGFTPPGWRYPAVLAGREIIFDDASRYDTPFGVSYGHGRTADENGRVPELDKLTGAYAVQAAKQAAEAQGWYCEINGDVLTIYHADGGTLTVDASGAVDAQGFHGVGCLAAVTSIGEAIGKTVNLEAKPEYYQALATVAASE